MVWADETALLGILRNLYDYIDEYIDRSNPDGKEHVGYIADRTGYPEVKKWLLKDLKLNPKTVVHDSINWGGIRYAIDNANS